MRGQRWMTRHEKKAKEGNRTNEIPKDSAPSILFYIVAQFFVRSNPESNDLGTWVPVKIMVTKIVTQTTLKNPMG